jgi:hypothetical protein
VLVEVLAGAVLAAISEFKVLDTEPEGGLDAVVMVLSLDAEGNGEGGGADVGSFRYPGKYPWE